MQVHHVNNWSFIDQLHTCIMASKVSLAFKYCTNIRNQTWAASCWDITMLISLELGYVTPALQPTCLHTLFAESTEYSTSSFLIAQASNMNVFALNDHCTETPNLYSIIAPRCMVHCTSHICTLSRQCAETSTYKLLTILVSDAHTTYDMCTCHT